MLFVWRNLRWSYDPHLVCHDAVTAEKHRSHRMLEGGEGGGANVFAREEGEEASKLNAHSQAGKEEGRKKPPHTAFFSMAGVRWLPPPEE